MTDRSVVARLRAEANQFISTMGRSAKATAGVGEAAEKASRQADTAFKRMAKAAQENSKHIDRIGNSALVAGGAITAGFAFGVKSIADFDQAMSGVNAALPEAGAKMADLRKLAIDLGKDTQFSSAEAAQGITEMAKAGVSAEAILGGGLKGALDLAAAGQLDVARAAEVAATALKQFNLEGTDLPHVADLYAAAAGKAQGSVEDIAQAMKFAGVTSNGLGISLEETVGTLGLFAEAGIIGEQAGTSLRSLLLSLTAPSEIAAGKMKELGIQVYDAQGKFIGLAPAAQQLHDRLGAVDEATRNAALGTIFGNEAINAARELYEGGARAVAKWTGQVNDAGFAAEQAAKLTDNLNGDIERLGGALDAVFVQNGDGINGALRGIVQNAEGMVESFGALPGPVQQGTLAVAGLTGVALLAVGAFAKAVTTGADLAESLNKIRETSPRAAKGLDLTTKAAKGLSIVAAAMAAGGVLDSIFGPDGGGMGTEGLIRDLTASDDAVAAFSERMKQFADESSNWWSSNQVTSYGDAIHDVFDPSTFQQIDNAAGAISSLFGIDNNSDVANANKALKDLDSVLTGLASSGQSEKAARLFAQFSKAAQEQGVSVDDLKRKLPGYSEALAGIENESNNAATAGGDVTESMGGVEAAAADAQEKVQELADSIRDFGKSATDADEAESKYQEALDKVTERLQKRKELQKELREEQAKSGKDRDPEAIARLKAELEDYAAGIDLTTKAGRENRDMLIGIADAAKETAAQTLETTGSEDKARESMSKSRKEFIDSAKALGVKGKAAEDLADKYGLIPEDVRTVVKADGAEVARVAVQKLIDTIARLNSKTVNIRYVVSGRLPNGGRSTAGGSTADADGGMHLSTGAGLVKAFADGGTIGAAQPQIRAAGGPGILWAETGAGPWEAFISGHPNKRARSRMIAQDTVERLGGRIHWARPFADGGILGGGGPVARSTDNSLNLYGDVVLPSATPRAMERDLRRRARYEANRSAS